MAGFIGHHMANKMIQQNHFVVGIDNLNDYYDVELKKARLHELGLESQESTSTKFQDVFFHPMDLCDEEGLNQLFQKYQFDRVIHLAAQAGVRYSLENPKVYVKSNVEGFLNILEQCRHHKIKHLIFASSSSVYGENKEVPFSPEHAVDHPISLYAATKRSNELMAHTYSHLFQLPCTGLRFFTVYGPWGRPDMAPFLFTDAIINNREIKVFNHGDMMRDFTFVDDIVEAISKLVDVLPESLEKNKPNTSDALFRLYNIGNSSPVKLLDFIETIEKHLKMKAQKKMLPMQAGDVPTTYADVSDIYQKIDFRPNTSLDEGIGQFIDWYKKYYQV